MFDFILNLFKKKEVVVTPNPDPVPVTVDGEKKEVVTSPSFSINYADLISLAKGALMVGGAAALTFIIDNLAKIDLGSNSIILIPIITMFLSTLSKWFNTNSYVVTKKEEVK